MWIQANNYMVANNITTPAARLAAGNAVVTTYRMTMITDNGISAIAESIAPGSGLTITANIYPVAGGSLTATATMTESPPASGYYVGTATIGTAAFIQYIDQNGVVRAQQNL